MITERYKDFRPGTEIGFQQTPGVTADIEPILKPDLIAILEHIKSSDDLLDTCKKNSAKAPFFNKFYLMANPEQGWNLRLHSFDVRGSGLGEEDSPHYHRWILASKILTGGYIRQLPRKPKNRPIIRTQHLLKIFNQRLKIASQ